MADAFIAARWSEQEEMRGAIVEEELLPHRADHDAGPHRETTAPDLPIRRPARRAMRITLAPGAACQHMHCAREQGHAAEGPQHDGGMLLRPLANGGETLKERHRRGPRFRKARDRVRCTPPSRSMAVPQRAS